GVRGKGEGVDGFDGFFARVQEALLDVDARDVAGDLRRHVRVLQGAEAGGAALAVEEGELAGGGGGRRGGGVARPGPPEEAEQDDGGDQETRPAVAQDGARDGGRNAGPRAGEARAVAGAGDPRSQGRRG